MSFRRLEREMNCQEKTERTYNILDTLEMSCDGTQCGRNNRLVQGDEEDGEAQRDDDEGELQPMGVVWLGASRRGDSVVRGLLRVALLAIEGRNAPGRDLGLVRREARRRVLLVARDRRGL